MSDFRATLDAWRERGADQFDPVRFRIIEAMERRAINHDGETRRVLNARLTELIDAFASDLAANVQPKAPDGESASGPLSGLIDYLANTRAPSAYPEMAALEYFRETWNRISTERQFRQSLAQVPGNAGPLNSRQPRASRVVIDARVVARVFAAVLIVCGRVVMARTDEHSERHRG